MKTSNLDPRAAAWVALAALAPTSCVNLPELGAGEGGDSTVVVEVDPSPDDPVHVPPVVQFRLASSDQGSPVDAAVVSRGELGQGDLGDLAAGVPSPSLQRRLVPVETWTDGEGKLVVVPMTSFEPGETISLGVPGRGWTRAWTVVDDGAARMMRVWPLQATGEWAGHAVWCVATPARGWAPVATTELKLGPEGKAGSLAAGMLEGYGAGCVRWDAAEEPPPTSILPPARVMLEDGRMGRIEPEAITGPVAEAGGEQGECAPGLVGVGPACGEVQDDRIVLFGGFPPALLGVEISGNRISGVPLDDAPMVLRGLVSDARNNGTVVFLDRWGRRFSGEFAVTTSEPLAHVVINEVMANPAGAEPAQEWVELYNDGLSTVQLGGWQLEDIGLAVELPSCALEPGGFALVVNEDFAADGWADRAPVAGTPLLRVPHLGKAGLSNAGEPLRLVRDDGVAASCVPAIASPKQSVSVARIAPDAWDSPVSFIPGEAGGTPGAANGEAR